MADILILQEEVLQDKVLSKSLLPDHNIEFVRSNDAVVRRLRWRKYDLLIARVHLRYNNLFELLIKLKADPRTASVPVLCFCGIRTRMANVANEAVRAATLACGAKCFLSLEQFCVNEHCDLARLKSAIEAVIFDGNWKVAT